MTVHEIKTGAVLAELDDLDSSDKGILTTVRSILAKEESRKRKERLLAARARADYQYVIVVHKISVTTGRRLLNPLAPSEPGRRGYFPDKRKLNLPRRVPPGAFGRYV